MALSGCLALGMLVGGFAAVVVPAGATAGPGDPLLDQQWGLRRIGAPAAWTTTRGEGMTVAVIDTGVVRDHEDLAGRVVTATACLGTLGDPAACRGEADDDDGHGTHVAGIIGATAGNGRGVAGVAPAAQLMVIRALRQVCAPLAGGAQDCRGIGATDDIRASIRWAVEHGAHVINVSWADDVVTRTSAGSPLAEEIRYAWEHGVIVVVAAGNDFDAAMGSGYGNLPMVVVTAITPDGDRASYANTIGTAPRWAFAAPGGDGSQQCPERDVISTYTSTGNADGYGCLAGTSMAAPHVAGAIALLRSLGLTPRETLDRLVATASDAGPPGPDTEFGAGVVNVARAVEGVARRPGGPVAGIPTSAPPAAPSDPAVPSGQAVDRATAGARHGPAGAPPSVPPTASRPPEQPPALAPPDEAALRAPTGDRRGAGSARAPWTIAAALLLLFDGALLERYRRRRVGAAS